MKTTFKELRKRKFVGIVMVLPEMDLVSIGEVNHMNGLCDCCKCFDDERELVVVAECVQPSAEEIEILKARWSSAAGSMVVGSRLELLR